MKNEIQLTFCKAVYVKDNIYLSDDFHNRKSGNIYVRVHEENSKTNAIGWDKGLYLITYVDSEQYVKNNLANIDCLVAYAKKWLTANGTMWMYDYYKDEMDL